MNCEMKVKICVVEHGVDIGEKVFVRKQMNSGVC